MIYETTMNKMIVVIESNYLIGAGGFAGMVGVWPRSFVAARLAGRWFRVGLLGRGFAG